MIYKHKKKIVLYQPRCKKCGFIVKSSTDVFTTKRLMQDHLSKSHRYLDSFTFVNQVPLSDFSELFNVVRWTDPIDIRKVLDTEKQPQFYAVAGCRPKVIA